MSYLPQYKIIDKCSQCGATNCKGRKRQKDYYCLSCIRGNDTSTQIAKSKQRDAEREAQIKALKPKEKKAIKSSVKNSVRSLIDNKGNREVASKSELLKRADKVFGDWIKRRDTAKIFDEDKQEEVDAIKCSCCKQWFDIEAVDGDNKKVVNVLHFVDRGVYSLRFDEDNCHAGCCFCNLDMHLHKFGKAFISYRRHLVSKIGEAAVIEMELAKRKFHKLDNSQLKNVIEHYGTN